MAVEQAASPVSSLASMQGTCKRIRGPRSLLQSPRRRSPLRRDRRLREFCNKTLPATPTTRSRLPVRPGDAALWRRRPDGSPPPLATNLDSKHKSSSLAAIARSAAFGQRQPRERRRPRAPSGQSRSSGTAPDAPDRRDRRVAAAIARRAPAGAHEQSCRPRQRHDPDRAKDKEGPAARHGRRQRGGRRRRSPDGECNRPRPAAERASRRIQGPQLDAQNRGVT